MVRLRTFASRSFMFLLTTSAGSRGSKDSLSLCCCYDSFTEETMKSHQDPKQSKTTCLYFDFLYTQVCSIWYGMHGMYAYFPRVHTVLHVYSDVCTLTCSLQVHLCQVFGEFTGACPCFPLTCDVGHCVPAACAITVDEVWVRRLHVHHLSMTSALITPARERRECQAAVARSK